MALAVGTPWRRRRTLIDPQAKGAGAAACVRHSPVPWCPHALVQVRHGYDRNGNRLYRENLVATAYGSRQDQLYAYDALNRLIEMQRGWLNAGGTGLTDKAFAQAWDLDKAGNWRTFRQDSQGDGAWDLVQPRVANNGNELVAIGATAGPTWAQPAYDPAGNMVAFPQPEAPEAGFTGVYDAWNRLVKVLDGTEVVAEYAYDGRSFRVKKTLGEDEWHLYYTSHWRLIEERLATPTPADLRRQYVWGLGINDLILRDRDTDRDGVLDERLYALHDSHWDMCAVVGTDGAVVERYEYEAYGTPRVLDPAFLGRAGSVCGWKVLYSGHLFDAETGLYAMRYRFYHPALGVWVTRDPLFDHWNKRVARQGSHYGYRYYSPELGRWLSKDPLEEIGGAHLYAMVANNPVCASDVLGLWVPGPEDVVEVIQWVLEQLGLINAPEQPQWIIHHNETRHKEECEAAGYKYCLVKKREEKKWAEVQLGILTWSTDREWWYQAERWENYDCCCRCGSLKETSELKSQKVSGRSALIFWYKGRIFYEKIKYDKDPNEKWGCYFF